MVMKVPREEGEDQEGLFGDNGDEERDWGAEGQQGVPDPRFYCHCLFWVY